MKNPAAFHKLCLSTLIAVYFLILVGGIVRSTGSGMGCPDWPRCFGQWVPPTSAAELPDDYRERYAAIRQEKNERFARYLRALGMEATADALLGDTTVAEEAEFNATRTWIEYLNRIVGVVIGLLILAVFIVSLRFRRERSGLTLLSFALFLLVGFQGWIGSVVVSTNLTPWTVTVHMMLALLIVAILIYLMFQSAPPRMTVRPGGAVPWLAGCMAVVVVQIVLGTQVREAIDLVAGNTPRAAWISAIGGDFIVHRSFSWVVILFHLGLILKLRKTQALKGFQLTLILLILGTIFTGLGMAWFAVPAFLQPLHLLLATGCFGVQYLFMLELNRKEISVLSD